MRSSTAPSRDSGHRPRPPGVSIQSCPRARGRRGGRQGEPRAVRGGPRRAAFVVGAAGRSAAVGCARPRRLEPKWYTPSGAAPSGRTRISTSSSIASASRRRCPRGFARVGDADQARRVTGDARNSGLHVQRRADRPRPPGGSPRSAPAPDSHEPRRVSRRRDRTRTRACRADTLTSSSARQNAAIESGTIAAHTGRALSGSGRNDQTDRRRARHEARSWRRDRRSATHAYGSRWRREKKKKLAVAAPTSLTSLGSLTRPSSRRTRSSIVS